MEKAAFALSVLVFLRRIPLSWDVVYGSIQVFLGLTIFELMYGRAIFGIVGISFFSHLLSRRFLWAALFYFLTFLVPWGAALIYSDKLDPFFRGEHLFEKPIWCQIGVTLLASLAWARIVVKRKPQQTEIAAQKEKNEPTRQP